MHHNNVLVVMSFLLLTTEWNKFYVPNGIENAINWNQ